MINAEQQRQWDEDGFFVIPRFAAPDVGQAMLERAIEISRAARGPSADGIVLVNRHICIGCRYCMMACPYKARSFVAEQLHDQVPWSPRGNGTVEACTFCVSRVDRGHKPACVDACAADGPGALVFGDMKDPGSRIAKMLATEQSSEVRADLKLNTGVRYHGI
jgi:molybdopterin-containing oxidoreductase family iron-sulfur binding subunit